MSEEINHLFKSLDQLSKMLKDAIEKADEASSYANEIGGEFEQELGTDLDSLQVSLQGLLEDLDSSIEEGETLRDDMKSMETGLRSGLDNEENYKIDSEHIQDERQQEREGKKRDRE